MQAKFIERILVVTGFADTFSVKEILKTGDVITKINGIPVSQLVKNDLYLTPASNYSTQLRSLWSNRLLRGQKDFMALEIIRDNNTKRVIIKYYCLSKINFGIIITLLLI